MLKILGYKENANQNDIEIPYHSSQNGYHQKTARRMLARMQEKKESSYTVGVNVNCGSQDGGSETYLMTLLNYSWVYI
jgi:hypothetical protein